MFAKIFAQIFDSSIADDWQVRHVFEDMLKLADQNGVVDITPEAIARRTNTPLEIVKRGIAELEKPDARSRNPEHNGARIVRLDEHRDWGWLIVNHAHYRGIASEQQRREKTLCRVQRHRAKSKRDVTPGNAGNAKQSQRQMQRQTENENVKVVNPTPGTDLTKLTRSALQRVAREIVGNKSGWHWENCKVTPDELKPRSLETVLQPYVGHLDESAVHECWQEAVRRAHAATGDELVQITPAGYCVTCFKEQLQTRAGPP